MNTELERLWNFLLDGYAGAAAATPRATILVRYKVRYNLEITDRTFRDQVSELVRIWKKPICTTPAGGYFVARTARERNHAINYLKSVGAEIFERARALEEADPLERQESLF